MNDEDNDSEYDDIEYQSGPYCQHWDDPGDCDDICARCGHKCCEHEHFDAPRACEVDGCNCDEFVDEMEESSDAKKI